MKKAFGVALGVAGSVSGFLEFGGIAGAAQAGALFGFQLLWAIVLGGACGALILWQSRRIKAVSREGYAAAIRERPGSGLSLLVSASFGSVAVILLTAQIGGTSIALEFATDVDYRWWVVPVGLVVSLVLLPGQRGCIDRCVSIPGLAALCFVVAAVKLDPEWGRIAHAMLPSLPEHESARYALLAVAIVGACITPALSGCVADGSPGRGRAAAVAALAFQVLVAAAILIVGAGMLLPRDIALDRYWDLPLPLKYMFGRWGVALVAVTLAATCFSAASWIVRSIAWVAGERRGPDGIADVRVHQPAARIICIAAIALAVAIVLGGPDPLQLAIYAMALSAVALPLGIVGLAIARSRPESAAR